MLAPGDLIQARNEVGKSASIRIDSIEADPLDRSGETQLYMVSVEGEAKGTWQPYCSSDVSGDAKAIPISGYWDDRGDFHDSSSVITLACTNGVIAKCVRWGYKPWRSIGGLSLKNYHLACVRMARADYCGDGVGHTRDGTPIDVFDLLGLQEREQGSMALEAGWSPNGATYINHTRWGDFAQVREECPDKLIGRTSAELPGLTPDEIKQRWPESLILNDSFLRNEKP